MESIKILGNKSTKTPKNEDNQKIFI